VIDIKAGVKSGALGVSIGVLLLLLHGSAMAQPDLVDALQELGKRVFFDKISTPPRMACVTCHVPKAGWTGGTSGVNLHQVAITGANPHEVGNLKPPSNAYSTFVPPFDGDKGGVFWNGRAEGNADPQGDEEAVSEHVGEEVFTTPEQEAAFSRFIGPTTDQALNPFNPVEQNIERLGVCEHVRDAKYAELYEFAWGEAINCSDDEEVDLSFKRIALALGAWQDSDEVNSFSSKRDKALREDGDGQFPLDGFTDQENLGHDLFFNITSDLNPEGKRANCLFCHNSGGPVDSEQVYTNHGYRNIGAPRNPEIPDSGGPQGLFDHTKNPDHRGRWKIPTLRNVDKRPGKGFTKAYMHNGWFKSLESVVHFYNTAEAKPRCESDVITEKEALAQDCWPAPEEPNGTSRGGPLGNLGLEPDDEAAIVSYLKTLTDTETPKQPSSYKPVQ
jgi:cytochrome c peroxidase